MDHETCQRLVEDHESALADLNRWRRRLRRVLYAVVAAALGGVGFGATTLYHVGFKRGTLETRLDALEHRVLRLEDRILGREEVP